MPNPPVRRKSAQWQSGPERPGRRPGPWTARLTPSFRQGDQPHRTLDFLTAWPRRRRMTGLMRRCILLLVLLWAPVVWAEPRVGVDPPEALVDVPCASGSTGSRRA